MAKIRINRRKDYKEQLKLYLNLSKSLNAKIKKLFRKTARKAEQEYLKYEDMYYFFLEDFSDDFYKILSNHYRAVITASGERLIKQRETKQESAIDLAVAKYIQNVTANKVADISQTTRKQIKQAIKKGIADGESIPIISKNIRQNNAFQPYRATMIARTETHSAMNYGNDEISKSLDFEKPVKTWNSALDVRTRSWHRAMNGTTIGRDEMFKVLTPVAGGAFTERSMSYTGDMNGGALNVINCRCFTLYYDSADDVIGATPQPDSPIVPVEDIPEVVVERNATSLLNPIKGSAIVVTKNKKELREDVKLNSTQGFTNEEDRKKYLPDRYGGSFDDNQYYTDDWNEKELTEVNILLEEANQLAVKNKLPKLKATLSVGRRNANASMGDGILHINKKLMKGKGSKYMLIKGADDANNDIITKQSNWQIGNTALTGTTQRVGKRQAVKADFNIPFSSAYYLLKGRRLKDLSDAEKLDLSLDMKRMTIYHEMGHHIHQQTRIAGTLDNIEDELRIVFNKAVRKDNKLIRQNGVSKLYPTGYSSYNHKEWFAENFALYNMGFKNKCSKDWIDFYENTVLKNL
tara:strand:- start:882 stop:2615 length:1734 start_codon:yes stop_codon:yes gene_type:complete